MDSITTPLASGGTTSLAGSPPEASGGRTGKMATQSEMAIGGKASVPDSQDSIKSLQALNTLLSASFTQDYTTARPMKRSPTDIGKPSDRQFEPILPAALREFAAAYPLITIASLGAIGSAVLLGAGSLTARALRAATGTRTPVSLDVRLDEMERRIVAILQHMQRKNIDGLNVAMRRVSMGEMGQGRQGAAAHTEPDLLQRSSSRGLGIFAVDHSRLRDAVKAVLEDGLTAERPSAEAGEGESARSLNDHQLEGLNGKLDRLETLSLGVLDEIKLLRASQTSATSAQPADNAGMRDVMSMDELSKMVEQFQLQANELNEGAVGETELDVDALAAEADPTSDQAQLASQLDDEEKIARAMYAGGGKEEAIEVITDELGKDLKAKKRRRSKAELAAGQQVSSPSQPEVSPETEEESIPFVGNRIEKPLSSASVKDDPIESTANQEDIGVEATPSAEPETSARVKRKYRKRTPLPHTPESGVDSGAARLGVDNSGAWSFRVKRALGNGSFKRGWGDIEIVLKRREEIKAWDENHIEYQSAELCFQSIQASAFHNLDLELIVLDGGVWHCYPKGGMRDEFHVGERLGDAES